MHMHSCIIIIPIFINLFKYPYRMMRRSLQRLPSSLNRSRSAKSIEQALQYSGVPEWDLIATAFRAEEIGSLDLACLLTIGEVREVLLKHNLNPTVGRVRHCVHAFSVASKHACADELVPSAQTVLMRSLLRQDPERVRETMAMRMTAESVFAALMLTIAFQACIEVPNLDLCIQEFGSHTCIALRRAYAVSWGLTAGFFLCSSLVSLASMQVFLPVGTVHFVIVAAEAYLTKSNTFIACGFIGLMISLHFTMIILYTDSLTVVILTLIVVWLSWALQFWKAYQAVLRVFAHVPGFDGFGSFWMGYIGLAAVEMTEGQVADKVGDSSRGPSFEMVDENAHVSSSRQHTTAAGSSCCTSPEQQSSSVQVKKGRVTLDA